MFRNSSNASFYFAPSSTLLPSRLRSNLAPDSTPYFGINVIFVFWSKFVIRKNRKSFSSLAQKKLKIRTRPCSAWGEEEKVFCAFARSCKNWLGETLFQSAEQTRSSVAQNGAILSDLGGFIRLISFSLDVFEYGVVSFKWSESRYWSSECLLGWHLKWKIDVDLAKTGSLSMQKVWWE